MRACESNRKLVRLTTGVDEVTNTQRLRQRSRELLRIFEYQITKISRIRVQHFHLSLPRRNDFRMTMPNVRDVVVRIKITLPLVVIQILPQPAHDM
jgi:hypothetical protein